MDWEEADFINPGRLTAARLAFLRDVANELGQRIQARIESGTAE
jgi:hypothetical protein